VAEFINQYSLDTANPPDMGGYSIDAGQRLQPVPANLADLRAFKIRFAMPYLEKSYQEVHQALLAGEEETLRREAAARADERNNARRELNITNTAKLLSDPSLTVNQRQYLRGQLELKNLVGAQMPSDPNVVFEDYYGGAYMDSLYDFYKRNPDGSFLNEALRTFPTATRQTIRAGSELISKHEVLRREIEDINEQLKNQSYVGYGVDYLKTWFPGYSEVKLRGNVPGVGFTAGGGLGSNMEQQAMELFRKPLSEFSDNLRKILEPLRKDNPQEALRFALALQGQSRSDVFYDNFFTAAIPAELYGLGLGRGALRATQSVAASVQTRMAVRHMERTRAATKDMVNSNAHNGEVTKATIAEATGDVSEAAVQASTTRVIAERANAPTSYIKNSLDNLLTYFRTDLDDIRARPGRHGREGIVRLEQNYDNTRQSLSDVIEYATKVERIQEIPATEQAIRDYQKAVRELYPGETILDITKPYKGINTWHYDIDFGKPGGDLFDKIESAMETVKHLGLLDAKIMTKGGSYFIRAQAKPLEETHPIIRNWLTQTKNSQTPTSWLNSFVGWLRTPEDTLSLDQRHARKVATYVPNLYLKTMQETAKELKDLAKTFGRRVEVDYINDNGEIVTKKITRKDRWRDFESVLKATRHLKDPASGEIGYFFRSPGELEDFYQLHLKRMPDQAEVAAFFSYKRLIESDAVFRELRLHTGMSRVGAEQHRVFTLDEAGKRVETPFFNGIRQAVFPGGDDTILVLNERVGQHKVFRGDAIPTDIKDELIQSVSDGTRKVIRVYDPELRPFTGFLDLDDNVRVRYVVTANVETKPLSFNNLPRRGGGHFEYDYDWYIKQARVKPETIGTKFAHWYEGDTTIMPVALRALGKDVAERLDKVRVLIKENKLDEAKAFVESGGLPMDWKDVKGWFHESFGPKGVKLPPRLNLDEPIRVVPRNKTIADVDDGLADRYKTSSGVSTFRDGTRQGSDARQNQIQYTGSRDAEELFTIRDIGSRHNPIYKLEPAKLVDPIPTMDRALTRIVNSQVMDDYKIASVEHWVREAGPFLRADPSDIQYAPFWHFHNPVWKTRTPDTAERISQLEVIHRQIQQFMGVQSKTDTLLHSVASKLYDSIYTNLGPKALPLDPSYMLPYLRDPLQFLRGFAFHAKLGLWNVAQILVQAQTYTNIYGIAGYKYASQGSMGALFHQASRMNKSPQILDHLDSMATKFGYRPGEFKEAMTELERTGFGYVSREHAFQDNMFAPSIIKSGFQDFLDAGTLFFRGSERNSRFGAWYTAYREFRDKNPTGRITDKERTIILERADQLSGNMSRASSSAMHTGIMAVPAQFYAYQLRIAEMFMGKRLTPVERFRMMATYAAMYGAPTAFGLTGLPVSDFIRKAAIENGYVVGDKWLNTLVDQGIPSMMLHLATGNYYNVGERYGIQGLETLREALRSDESFWKIVGGASFSTLAGTWEHSDGFIKAIMSGIRGDGQFRPKVEDAVGIFKEFSLVNAAWKTYYGIQFGRWISKNERYLHDVTPAMAVLMGTTGLQLQSTSDLQIMSWSLKDQKEAEKHVENRFIQEFRRGINAHANNNHQQGADYFKRAFNILDVMQYPEEKLGTLISRASKDHESLIESINWDFYIKNAPKGQHDARMKAFQRIHQLEQQRQGR